MLRFKTLLSVISCLVMVSTNIAYAENNSSQDLKDLNGNASIWKYTSLCEFKDTKYIQLSKTYSKGSYSFEGCNGLQNRYGKPPAVIISLSNEGTEPRKIVLPKLTEITLHTKEGLILQAIAVRDASNFGMGTTYAFMTTMTSWIRFKIEPGGKIDLIFLFSKAVIGDKAFIGQYLPITISK